MAEGTVLAGKYRLTSLLGRGGMGVVWRAEHLGLSAPIAVKLLDAAVAATIEGLARFQREARAAAGLRSPHVVQILDHGVDEESGTPFIVMELLDGENLAQRLARTQTLPALEVARIITHVGRALVRAHEAGVVHRDLKPDNIFLVRNEDDEIAKVLDFGVAKEETLPLGEAATIVGTIMGTPYYMSPEQISGKPVDQRADLWALAVIACECLTGRRPFDAENLSALTLAICAEPIVQPSNLGPVPAGFDAWFARAVNRDLSQRFQTAREATEELQRVCGAQSRPFLAPVQALPTPAPAAPVVAPSVGGSSAALVHAAEPRDSVRLLQGGAWARWLLFAAVLAVPALVLAFKWAGNKTAMPPARETPSSLPASGVTKTEITQLPDATLELQVEPAQSVLQVPSASASAAASVSPSHVPVPHAQLPLRSPLPLPKPIPPRLSNSAPVASTPAAAGSQRTPKPAASGSASTVTDPKVLKALTSRH